MTILFYVLPFLRILLLGTPLLSEILPGMIIGSFDSFEGLNIHSHAYVGTANLNGVLTTLLVAKGDGNKYFETYLNEVLNLMHNLEYL